MTTEKKPESTPGLTLEQHGMESMTFALALLLGGVFGAKLGLAWAVGIASLYIVLSLTCIVLSVAGALKARAALLDATATNWVHLTTDETNRQPHTLTDSPASSTRHA